MARDSKPIYGLAQPARGLNVDVESKPMKSKRNRPDRMKTVVANNVKERMRLRYRTARSENAMITALAEESGVGRSTIQRVLDPLTYGSHKTTIDTVARLAMALRCETYELLMEPRPEDDLPS